MVCSLHSVTTGSRDRANVPLIIIIIIIYQNTPRPSGHKKHLGGIKGYKYITSSWYLINGYPDEDNLGSTVPV